MQKRTNGFLFSTMNRFGDERLQSFENALSPETAECLTHIALETHLIILNVTYWECHAPWLVPERRICDNFMLFVESGEESISNEENAALGAKLVGFDRVILVGDTLVGYIREGYLGAGGDPEKLTVVPTLFKAEELLSGNLKKGDAVLFLNDLPDVYK